MRKTSLASAKAHLSELVDDVEHRGRRIIILRHGRPAAAIVPVAVAAPEAAPRSMTAKQIARLLASVAEGADPEVSAVDDLLRSRR